MVVIGNKWFLLPLGIYSDTNHNTP